MSRAALWLSVFALTAVALAVGLAEGAAAPGGGRVGNGSGSDGSNRCAWMLDSGSSVTRFSSMPGGGWDNLRNKDMGLVADLSFADCTLSDDGMFVLPPNVILYARKESAVEVMAEVMNHYSNYTSSVSANINVGTNGILDFLGIGGKLSDEFEQVKSIAIENKLDIGRTQLRYRLYSAKLQPDFKLSRSLTNRLTDIVSALVNNRTKLARYLSDLVVRDFGTHAVTSVEAGGILEKLDFFQASSVANRDFMQNKFAASMSVSFHKLLGVDIGGGSTVTNEDLTTYQQSVKKMSVRSYGGPILGPNPKLTDWMKSLKENLVPMDREGEPLYAVIQRHSLPNLPLTHLLQLRKHIEDAVMRYYKANLVKGCQDPNSPSFDPLANVAGHCETPASNFSFAGVYQTCTESNPSAGLGLCNPGGGAVPNPITGDFTCPAGYESVKLISTVGRSGRRCVQKSHSCWLFFTCDDGVECFESVSTLTAYWCAARRGARLRANSGMVFGGAYAGDGRFVNDITKAKSCGEFFKPYQVGRDVFICLSMDLNSATRLRIPFAGFFACQSGNPLAEPGRPLVAASGTANAAAGVNESPKHCPEGFSQVTLDTIDGCAVMQCVKGRSGLNRLHVRRPPFEEPDYELIESPIARVESHGWRWGYNASRNAWTFLGFFGGDSEVPKRSDEVTGSVAIGAAASVNKDASPPQSSSSTSSNASTGILVAVGCLAFVAIIAMAVYLARRRRAAGRGGNFRRVLRDLRSQAFGRRGRQRRRGGGDGDGGDAGAPSGGVASGYREVPLADDEDDEAERPLTQQEGGRCNDGYGSMEADEAVCNDVEPAEVDMEDDVEVVVHRRPGVAV